MIFEQIATGGCQSYLLGCGETRAAVLIDANLARIDQYSILAARHGLRIRFVLDTHTHADHFSAARELGQRWNARVVTHRLSPAPYAELFLDDGDRLQVGEVVLQALHTPGHTRDSMCLVAEDRLFTGDTLLIGSAGRTDLPTGDPEALHDSLFNRVLKLDPALKVHPAHDYNGRGHSTLSAEIATNPRLQKRDRDSFVAMMRGLNLEAPIHLTEALRTNMHGGKPLAQLLSDAAGRIASVSAAELAAAEDFVVLDVRERGAFAAGHIPGARHLPRGQLELQVDRQLPDPCQRILVYCETGDISTLAAATLLELGFTRAASLTGGARRLADARTSHIKPLALGYPAVNQPLLRSPSLFEAPDFMCGIAVAIEWNDAEATVRQLVQGILHRGDITDPLVSPRKNTVMCTRRLRIVDAAHGEQPAASFDGRLLISFNGEIYNHAALRRELEQTGITFRTQSDTEVLVNALQVWGASALKRLQGMYAFVVVDTVTGEFLAARDPFGVKPLYLIQSGSGFLFCSEMQPLLAAVPDAEVMLLPPGYLLTRNFCRQFYHLPAIKFFQAGSPQALDQILSDAVRIRIPPDLPFASLFSGGIDSTLVTHYARRHRPEMPAYIIAGRDAPDYRYAKAYADQTKLDLREVTFEAHSRETLSLLENIVQSVEAFEPAIVRPSLYAHLVARRIHQDGFRVALCGEGADELFAGYGPLEHVFAESNELGRHVQEQCLSMMHRANLQRVDRSGMRYELEIREPFLDLALVEYAAKLDRSALVKTVDGLPQGKQPLRAVYDLYPNELPAIIRDRKKVHFEEGAGIGSERGCWAALFEDAVSDGEFADGKKRFAAFELATKEEFFYLRALARHMDVNRVAHLKARTRLLVPEGTKAMPEAMKRITPASG